MNEAAPPNPLKVPLHFVCYPDFVWPELRDASPAEMTPDQLAERSVEALDCLLLRPYYEFRHRGADVTLSDRTDPTRINIADVYHFGRRQRDLGAFVVVPRADGHIPAIADVVLRQDLNCAAQGSLDWVPMWVQPGIRPRARERGERFDHIAYKGRMSNLDPAFRAQGFLDALAELGIRISLPDETKNDGLYWADYTACDAVVAVRNLTLYDAANKPPTKLINAWWADTPALLGPEPTYQALRRSELDFVEIRTPADILAAARLLRDEPRRAEAMRENGRMRRAEHTDKAVFGRWIEVLNGPVADAFTAWRGTPLPLRMARTAVNFLREPSRKAEHQRRYSTGPRLLDPAPPKAD